MNQVLKESVYGSGTAKQVNAIALLGGMNEEEIKLLNLAHLLKNDDYIQCEMSLERSARKKIEDSMRKKTLVGIMHCIDYTIEHELKM